MIFIYIPKYFTSNSIKFQILQITLYLNINYNPIIRLKQFIDFEFSNFYYHLCRLLNYDSLNYLTKSYLIYLKAVLLREFYFNSAKNSLKNHFKKESSFANFN